MIEIPVEGEILFRTRDEILAEYQEQMQLLIPDVYLGEDGNLNLLFQVMAGVTESVFLANQILSEDMFPSTANADSLEKWGDNYGVPRKEGVKATGSILLAGEGGTPVPLGAEVAYDSGTGEDPLYFLTTGSGTIPNPGIPSAPVAADAAVGVLAAGTYEYAASFVTAEGETEIGAVSNAVTVAVNRQISLVVPVGGPGTTARRIYRRLNGGAWARVAGLDATFNNNVTTNANDNNAAPGGGLPLEESTAERITLTAEAENAGEMYNVGAGAITVVADVPDGVTSVTNLVPFTGGTDQEEIEDYRIRLLKVIRAPSTGSPSDLEVWALEVAGVETATIFQNDNLGTPTNGHTTVRISGPGGTIPSAGIQADVLAHLQSKDLANITLHVGTFTSISTDVTVTVTLATGYVLADVTAGVQKLIQDYINGLLVGETLRISGIIAAVFGMPGIVDITVSVPASNQATGATSKRVPGTITVN